MSRDDDKCDWCHLPLPLIPRHSGPRRFCNIDCEAEYTAHYDGRPEDHQEVCDGDDSDDYE